MRAQRRRRLRRTTRQFTQWRRRPAARAAPANFTSGFNGPGGARGQCVARSPSAPATVGCGGRPGERERAATEAVERRNARRETPGAYPPWPRASRSAAATSAVSATRARRATGNGAEFEPRCASGGIAEAQDVVSGTTSGQLSLSQTAIGGDGGNGSLHDAGSGRRRAQPAQPRHVERAGRCRAARHRRRRAATAARLGGNAGERARLRRRGGVRRRRAAASACGRRERRLRSGARAALPRFPEWRAPRRSRRARARWGTAIAS